MIIFVSMELLAYIAFFLGFIYVALCILALSFTLYRDWKVKRENKKEIVYDTNSGMRKLLEENGFKNLLSINTKASKRLGKYLDIEYIEKYDSYSYKGNDFSLLWDDMTGNEFSSNKIVIENSSDSMNEAISFAISLCKVLMKYPQEFSVVLSCDRSYITISFYTKRKDNTFFDKDLENYKEEALLVFSIVNTSLKSQRHN